MRNDRHRKKEDDWSFFCDFPPINMVLKAFPHDLFHHEKGMSFKNFGDIFTHGLKHPLTNIERNEKEYKITMEIPGISKDQINLEVTVDELWFNAENKELDKEYNYHTYFRTPIKSDEISAKLKAGVLTITAPFSEMNPKRKVNIN